MSKQSQYRRFIGLFVTGALLFVTQSAWSAGFQLLEQNASNLGTAYAGAASIAEDASTGFYNAAGLTRLGDEQLAASAVWIDPHSSLSATRATPTFSLRNQGPNGTRPEGSALVPALHYAGRLDDCWVFGLNITSPFGLKNKYKNDSIARYTATRSTLKTVDIGPSIAYDFQNGLSVGVGVDALYAIAKLDSRIGTGNLNTDGFLENTASNWGYGYHGGILFEATDCTRFGLSYRSKVKVKTYGESVRQVFAGLPEFRQGVKANVTLPETVIFSAYHGFNEQWALMADVQWVHWTRFRQLALRFDDGTRITTTENFKNAVRASLGVSFQCDEQWKFSLGSAYDKTPTRKETRTIRIPDQNRIWAAAGVQYRFSKCLALDVGYAHLFFKKANINEPASTVFPARNQTLQSIEGRSKTRADLIGIQLTWDLV